MYGSCRTGICAGAASDTFRRGRFFHRIDIHSTDFFAFSAADAFAAVYFQLTEADLIEQAIDGAQRTDHPAEKAVDQYAADERQNKDCCFQAE